MIEVKIQNRRTGPQIKNMESFEELKKFGSLGPKFYFFVKICILFLLSLNPYIDLLIVFLEFRTGIGEVGQRLKTNGLKTQNR